MTREMVDDLLIEILLRVPFKSLIRFKSVSKHWLSVINSPQFSRRRNTKPNAAVGLFSYRLSNNCCYEYMSFFPHEGSMEKPILDFNFAVEPTRTEIVNSCNGLLLCCSRSSKHGKNYYVYNPTTNQSCELPQVVDDEDHEFRGISLAFDQVKSSHYTVVYVQLSNAFSPFSYRILLYSSAEPGASWTTAAKSHEGRFHYNKGVYCNGSIHWISSYIYDRRNSLRFDIDNKTLHEIPSPPAYDDEHNYSINYSFYLGQSCDHLHYIYKNKYDAKFHVYEMKMDYSEWFVKYQVDLSSLHNAYRNMGSLTERRSTYSIFGVVRGEHEDNSCLVMHISGEAIKYNLVDKTFEHLLNFPVFSSQFLYIETVCPVA